MTYCGKCGSRLEVGEKTPAKPEENPRSRLCVSCGKEIEWYANICPYCGRFYGSVCLPGGYAVMPTWKPVAAGIICILLGLMRLVNSFGYDYYYYSMSYYIGGLSIVFMLILPLIAIIGGAAAIARRYWAFSIIGAICGIVPLLIGYWSFLSIVFIALAALAVVLIVVSKGEFKK